jgi:undecaprenyl-diphosphatase
VWKQRDLLQWSDLPMFAIGTVFAFFSAWLCIRWLIRYVSTHDFTVFAWYRIRVWGGGAVDGVYGVGGVEGVTWRCSRLE